jgi:hypothetical protein
MAAEPRDPAVGNDSNKKEGKGELIKAPIRLQDLWERGQPDLPHLIFVTTVGRMLQTE